MVTSIESHGTQYVGFISFLSQYNSPDTHTAVSLEMGDILDQIVGILRQQTGIDPPQPENCEDGDDDYDVEGLRVLLQDYIVAINNRNHWKVAVEVMEIGVSQENGQAVIISCDPV